jgi:excinuclease UvrABC helicase subunit UvrB
VKAVHELEEFQYEAKRQGLSLLRDVETGPLSKESLPRVIEEVERRMNAAADSLDFELAAVLRDQLFELKGMSPLGSKQSTAKAKRRKR